MWTKHLNTIAMLSWVESSCWDKMCTRVMVCSWTQRDESCSYVSMCMCLHTWVHHTTCTCVASRFTYYSTKGFDCMCLATTTSSIYVCSWEKYFYFDSVVFRRVRPHMRWCCIQVLCSSSFPSSNTCWLCTLATMSRWLCYSQSMKVRGCSERQLICWCHYKATISTARCLSKRKLLESRLRLI